MEFDFDPAKDKANQATHGVSLAAASNLAWDEALVWIDSRKNYGEARQIAIAPLGDRLHVCVFTDRGDVRRVISLRKANEREFDRYESEIDSTD